MSMIKEKLEYKPPWFTLQVIGIAGASASGKTSVAKALVKKLNVRFLVPVPEFPNLFRCLGLF
jgi:deoxyadenosine/deoxycytidine kinase